MAIHRIIRHECLRQRIQAIAYGCVCGGVSECSILLKIYVGIGIRERRTVSEEMTGEIYKRPSESANGQV